MRQPGRSGPLTSKVLKFRCRVSWFIQAVQRQLSLDRQSEWRMEEAQTRERDERTNRSQKLGLSGGVRQVSTLMNRLPLHGPRSYRVVLFSWAEDSGTTSTPASVIETLRPGSAVELLRMAWRPGLHLGLLGTLARTRGCNS